MLKAAITAIGAENIANNAREFLREIVDQKKKIPMLPGESDIVAVIYEHENTPYFSIAAINDLNHIVRVVEFSPLENFIKQYLENL